MLAILAGHPDGVGGATSSPDGRWVLTGIGAGTARLYLVYLEDLVAPAKSRVTRELTCKERVQYLHEKRACPTLTLTVP